VPEENTSWKKDENQKPTLPSITTLQCNEWHSSPPVRKCDTNKMDRSDFERRLFQSVTIYIDQNWYLTIIDRS